MATLQGIFKVKYGILIFIAIFIAPMNLSAEATSHILFLGDSLTAGFGVEPEQSYPSLIQKKIEEAGLKAKVSNAGISGDTTAGGLRRLNWLMKQQIDILVLALGANDGLRGIAPEETKKNLTAIIAEVRKRNPEVKVCLAGMLVPPNMGSAYAESFKQVFPIVAKDNNATLLPFLLEGVAADPKLNLADGIHPNPEGYKLVAENVWQVLLPMLKL